MSLQHEGALTDGARKLAFYRPLPHQIPNSNPATRLSPTFVSIERFKMRQYMRFTLLSILSVTSLCACMTSHVVRYRRFNSVSLDKMMEFHGRGIDMDFSSQSHGYLDFFLQIEGVPDFHYCNSLKLGNGNNRRGKIGDNDFKSIAPCLKKSPHFTSLNLSDTDISDASMDEITRLRYLRQLDLSGTKVSISSFESLGRMKSLVSLKLKRTAIPEADRNTLEHKLMNCEIEW
ncbi:MAG: hypothetical protein ACE361_27240 [Aureliella sp.]